MNPSGGALRPTRWSPAGLERSAASSTSFNGSAQAVVGARHEMARRLIACNRNLVAVLEGKGKEMMGGSWPPPPPGPHTAPHRARRKKIRQVRRPSGTKGPRR